MKTTKNRRRMSAVALALVLTACGSQSCSSVDLPGADTANGDELGDQDSGAPTPGDLGARYAEHLCAALDRCGCSGFASDADCREEIGAQFNERAENLGPTTYAEACFQDVLEWFDEQECERRSELGAATQPPGCLLFFGDRGEGVECETHNTIASVGHNCRPSLQCFAGIECLPQDVSLHTAAVGESCGTATTICEPGTYCDRGECVPTVEDGSTCSTGFECQRTSFCQRDAEESVGTCAARQPPGAPCDPSMPDVCAPQCVPVEGGVRCDAALCLDGTCSAVPLVCESNLY